MNFWVLSDTHFGHENIKNYCGRSDNFEALILQNLAGLKGVLIHLGDFCLANPVYWHRRFFEASTAAKHWLVLGNHDRKSKSWYLDQGWDFVGDGIELEIYGKQVSLTHRPYECHGVINVHGHCHNTGTEPKDEWHRLVKLEHEYKSISLRDLV